jgi:phosphatidate cytidylyltransferase
MGPLVKRFATAFLLLPPILYALSWGPIACAALLAILTLLGARELARLYRSRGTHVGFVSPAVAGILVLASQARPDLLPLEAAAAGIVIGAMTLELFRRGGNMLHGMPVVLVGALYLGLLPAHLLRFYDLGQGPGPDPRPVYFALALVWGSDTGAYLTGSAFGRHKLWPRVSPAKSWEGAVGGVLVPIVLAVLLGGWIGRFPLAGRIGAGLLVGLAAQVGDLAESLMKREAAIKDSGRTFPGHGGVLDRLDSLFFAVPVLYYWIRLSMRVL